MSSPGGGSGLMTCLAQLLFILCVTQQQRKHTRAMKTRANHMIRIQDYDLLLLGKIKGHKWSLQEKKLYCNKLFCCNKVEIFAIKPYCNKNISLHVIAINLVVIGYCDKIFVAIAFYCNKNIFIIIKNTLLQQKYCCYNLL